MKKLLGLFLLNTLLVGCGLFSEDNDQSTRTYEDPKQGERDFNNSSVTCAEGECHPSVGGLYYLKYPNFSTIGVCSMTLVAADRILTNYHCVPTDLRFSGAKCEGRFKVHFPQIKEYGAEAHECSVIEKISAPQEGVNAPDWAIIRLKGLSQRPPAIISQKGLGFDQNVTLYKIDFNLHSAVLNRGSVVKTECKVNNNHLLAVDSVGPFSPLFNINTCDNKIIGGNSGSGIFNSAGELAGLLSFRVPIEDSVDQTSLDSKELRNLRRKYPSMWQNMGGGTNITCIPFAGSSESKECEFDYATNKELGLAYARLVQLKSHPQYEELGVNLLEKNRDENVILEFARLSAPDLKRFDFEINDSAPALNEVLTEEALYYYFTVLAKCVQPAAPESFEFVYYLPSPMVGRKVVDKKTHRSTINSGMVGYKFNAKQTAAGDYQITPASVRLFGWSFNAKKSLHIAERHSFAINVPLCKAFGPQ